MFATLFNQLLEDQKSFAEKRMKPERAQLGIDGNCGFALLGENIQEGECEFVEIEAPGDYEARRRAAGMAFRKLKERLQKPNLSYCLGPGLCQ